MNEHEKKLRAWLEERWGEKFEDEYVPEYVTSTLEDLRKMKRARVRVTEEYDIIYVEDYDPLYAENPYHQQHLENPTRREEVVAVEDFDPDEEYTDVWTDDWLPWANEERPNLGFYREAARALETES